jgi:hypothetical protein
MLLRQALENISRPAALDESLHEPEIREVQLVRLEITRGYDDIAVEARDDL